MSDASNNFVETFNDFTQPLTDHYEARTDAAVITLPPVITEQLSSRYEHTHFAPPVPANGAELHILPMIGTGADELRSWMESLCNSLISTWESFYIVPRLDENNFVIKGIARLPKDRRGPFIVALQNTDQPGVFAVKVSSHVCAMQSKLHKVIAGQQESYTFESSGGFYYFSFDLPVDGTTWIACCRAVLKLVQHADDVELRVTKGDLMPPM